MKTIELKSDIDPTKVKSQIVGLAGGPESGLLARTKSMNTSGYYHIHHEEMTSYQRKVHKKLLKENINILDRKNISTYLIATKKIIHPRVLANQIVKFYSEDKSLNEDHLVNLIQFGMEELVEEVVKAIKNES